MKLGAPINVIVTVTNISTGDIYWNSDIGKNSQYKGFNFLLAKNGREAETTFFHRKIAGRQQSDDPHEVAGGSSVTLAHRPGKMFEIPIDLTRLYKITEPGIYKLKVSRYDESTRQTVQSNTLTLRIVP